MYCTRIPSPGSLLFCAQWEGRDIMHSQSCGPIILCLCREGRGNHGGGQEETLVGGLLTLVLTVKGQEYKDSFHSWKETS